MRPAGPPPILRVVALTALSLLAFAANSILCRLALAEQRIGAGAFTALRLVSGALVLALLAQRALRTAAWPGTLASTLALFLYAAPFSFAYLRLGAGMGALVLFACVQATMISAGVVRGERAAASTWLGLALALGGLVLLAAPSDATAPDPLYVLLMAMAGVAWGVYSLRGRASTSGPLPTTAANFIGTVPLALVLALITHSARGAETTWPGVALAVASGALASGVGYSLWYAALPSLSATRAAVLQLLVPVIAIAGGALVLGEALSVRLLIASAVILSGVALATFGARLSRRSAS